MGYNFQIFLHWNEGDNILLKKNLLLLFSWESLECYTMHAYAANILNKRHINILFPGDSKQHVKHEYCY